MRKNTKSNSARRWGALDVALAVVKWMPAAAFLVVFADNGDLSYLSCAAASVIFPTLKAAR